MKITYDQCQERFAWPLKKKVAWALKQIRIWYDYWDGKVYVSFSGGKDSTVLLHLVRSLYPDVPAVFCNTRMEFPEIVRFVLATPNIVILRPRKTPRQVIHDCGWPVISKENAQRIEEIRVARSHSNEQWARRQQYGERLNGKTAFHLPKRWWYMLQAPFTISSRCCDVMKKNPFKKYVKETDRQGILGTMASDSIMREKSYLRYGCNAFNVKRPASRPLSIWTEADVWEYIRAEEIEYCPIYDMGYDRTGCVFCGFGVHMEGSPNRFQRMKQTHPRLWRYCMDSLGMREVMKFMGVPVESCVLGKNPFERMRERLHKKGTML